MSRNDIPHIVICGLIPYFLEKPNIWFEQNHKKIIEASKTQSFFHDNTLFCEKSGTYHFSQFLRKIDELGYEKVLQVREPGEFSRRGGIIEIFPINSDSAVRIEFYGNIVECIETVPTVLSGGEEARIRILKKIKKAKIYSDLSAIKPGDHLVHIDHGIGKFMGFTIFPSSDTSTNVAPITEPTETALETEEGGETKTKYYVLEYAKGDKLFVPISLKRKLSRYIGFAEPTISRLSSPLWIRTKRKIREESEKFARELLELYAQRELARRPPYHIEPEIRAALVSSFPSEATPDQAHAMKEIEKDLQQEKPMDRIICGDVAFGKTEIALRTAVYAAYTGYQVAFICPTTILAHQHYQTFSERLKNFPFTVALLSRLQTKIQQKEILSRLKTGMVDILIGTHRILSSDVIFKNLGLLIIDDEQRFGVKQKEKLKNKKATLDVLSLSATPIPRTLYLALSSLKAISTIQTPPLGRVAVKTFVGPWSPKKIQQALLFELKRKGQTYYLHNRIDTLLATKNFLQKLAPKAHIAVVHGKLPEHIMMTTMERFRKKTIDILLATTIIENGLDLEHANTLIVDNAAKLGLAQAHQIKGRIGRGNLQAYAYFFHGKRLTDEAKERLRALKEMQELGAGWRIALKDLELRGAGDILGKEQSGNINRVGLNLYCQMLSETMENLREKIGISLNKEDVSE